MLDAGRYLLGVAEVGLLGGFAWLGATAVRSRLLPVQGGAPAHLATAVLAFSLLLWLAELLGSFGFFEPLPYLVAVVVVGSGLWLAVGGGWGRPSGLLGFSPAESLASRGRCRGEKEDAAAPEGRPHPPSVVALVAAAVATVAVIHFAAGVKPKLSTGMTGFDSTWYHGPFAAGFFQGGDTWSLHVIAPQFLAWFYPANSEVFHAIGMGAFGRDILSPLLNLGWFLGCLVAAWCIGRPYKVAPWSLALAAVALGLPALHDQAGEARNDIVGIFFLLAAVALAVNAWAVRKDGERLGLGAIALVGLAAGLAAGTKLNFLLPAAVLVAGIGVIAPPGRRWRAFAVAGLAALAGGGYWYLRNLAHAGNPLPWVKHLGPIGLPSPDQALGGRKGHSVLGYLTDGTVWSDWFLPGLHHGLTLLWPLLTGLALAGLFLSIVPLLRCAFSLHSGEIAHRSGDPALAIAGLAGLAAVVAWLIAPTSASGPDGMPGGFESGLRYLAPALVLGLALLPTTSATRRLISVVRSYFSSAGEEKYDRNGARAPGGGQRSYLSPDDRKKYDRVGGWPVVVVVLVALILAAAGYPVQRHYLPERYAGPTFTTPGLDAAFAWAQGIDGARIATTSTRQYPLYGRDLSNEVDYVGEERAHGGLVAPTTCRRWRQLLNAGNYDYVVATRDRIEPGKPVYPPSASWTADPNAEPVLRKSPTVVFRLRGKLPPSSCPS